jgi:PIN domain nuclease of toxin-antitoxin system
VRLLLDSYIFLWLMDDISKVSPAVIAAVINPTNEKFASVVSVAELRVKQKIGKLQLPENFDLAIIETGFDMLAFTIDHAHWLNRLELHHRDPFDRMLIAQALHEGLTIVTQDRVFSEYPVPLMIN